jgi:hypothetical protein
MDMNMEMDMYMDMDMTMSNINMTRNMIMNMHIHVHVHLCQQPQNKGTFKYTSSRGLFLTCKEITVVLYIYTA